MAMDMNGKFKIALIAILRLIETTPEGVETKSLLFRSGLKSSELEAALTMLQKEKILAIKGRSLKFIKGSNFDAALPE